jgi:hypothetical protein
MKSHTYHRFSVAQTHIIRMSTGGGGAFNDASWLKKNCDDAYDAMVEEEGAVVCELFFDAVVAMGGKMTNGDECHVQIRKHGCYVWKYDGRQKSSV